MLLLSRLLRRKKLAAGQLETPLRRCLSTFDLTILGCAHMIGTGIFILSGEVLKNKAGPSIVLSFIIAGFAALLCSLCYAEFGARYPRAGSAYTYAYIGLGELFAFLIGWNIILEYAVGAAATSSALSAYVDSLCDNAISNFTISITGEMGGNSSVIARYPDVLAVLLVILVSSAVALGPKQSLRFMTLFSVFKFLVIALTICYSAFFVDFANWHGVNSTGNLRFFPFGIDGTLKGAATCFFAFIGFEGLATAAEEAKEPAKSLPRAAVLAMLTATLVYVLMSGTLSLMVPIDIIDEKSAFPSAFAVHGVEWARFAVAIGGICAMTAALCAGLFSLPRSVYSMASDGLLFAWWSRVNARTRRPINACITFSLLVCTMTFLFDLDALVDFLSIGTLMAYTAVSAAVIVLRYQPGRNTEGKVDRGGTLRLPIPFLSSHSGTPLILACLSVMVASFASMGVLFNHLDRSNVWCIIGISLLFLLGFSCVAVIACHRQNNTQLTFKTPLVPFLPSCSLLINILMMCQLATLTWLRFWIWMAIGVVIYFAYGMQHSKENGRPNSDLVSDCNAQMGDLDNADEKKSTS